MRVLCFIATVGWTSLSLKADACSVFNPDPSPSWQASTSRRAVGDYLARLNIPLLSKNTRNGLIPVALLTAENVQSFQALFDASYGLIHQQQPNWRNDHGLIRIGSTLIDVDEPGARLWGEINQTGLSWFDIYENTARKLDKERPEPRVEVLYLLDPEELRAARFYHLVRRAAMVRVPCSFNTALNYRQLPNVAMVASEQCYTFSKSALAAAVRDYAKAQAHLLAANQGPNFLESPAVLDFVRQVEQALLNVKIEYHPDRDAPKLTHDFIVRQNLLRTWQAIGPNSMSTDTALVLANWVIAYHAAKRYSALLKTLEISSNYHLTEIEARRAHLIVIHNYSPAAVRAFANASYTSSGVHQNWDNQGQRIYDSSDFAEH